MHKVRRGAFSAMYLVWKITLVREREKGNSEQYLKKDISEFMFDYKTKIVIKNKLFKNFLYTLTNNHVHAII